MLLINDLLIPFILTEAIELSVAFIFGFRKKDELLAVGLVNLVTNPILNLVIDTYYLLSNQSLNIIWILLAEIAVVLIEWKLIAYALKDKSREILVLSTAMNACSFLAGFLIFR